VVLAVHEISAGDGTARAIERVLSARWVQASVVDELLLVQDKNRVT
jgi:hypothetical protein